MKTQEKKQLNIPDIDTMNKEEIVSFFVETQRIIDETAELSKQVKMLENELKMAQEIISNLNQRLYGKKSEKTKAIEGQLSLLFDEVEITAGSNNDEVETPEEVEEETITYTRKKGRKKITESNPNLDVKVIEHVLEDCIAQGYEVIGSKETEKFIYKPAELYIQKDIYPVYRKENEDGTDDIKTLYEGYQFLDKSPATPRLVASILNDKYAKALPLYRIEDSFRNMGANISRQSMSNWVIASSQKYLEPLYELMKEALIQKDIIHADETTVQVLNHQDDSTNIKSYMWLYRSGIHDDKIIIYEYQPGRAAHYPQEFLKNFKGYLQTDGYEVYKKIEHTIQVGCLAHGRRKIKEAIQVMQTKTEGTALGTQIFKTMNTILKQDRVIHRTSENLTQIKEKRQEILSELFDNLEKELHEAQAKLLPKSNLGKAINYNLNQFETFKNVLLDPRLELTNNIAERAIKPFVIGRKNWIFFNTTAGAKSSAIAYSIIQSAKDNGLKVEDYLTHVFETISKKQDPISKEKLEALLPHSNSLPQHLYSKKYK